MEKAITGVKDLMEPALSPIGNFIRRQWYLFLADNADKCAEVATQQEKQAAADALTYQKRAALYRSLARSCR